ncbi:spore germination protein [Paenibacillus hexagrammi]|uniref:Spore germination protein n=1 Tax=Paenibacillus hexagrammi TaxID=2908839 RepID=A0ABY3SEV5_9BACL|nr:spore germination protein [Paenibacillus sp. YPD9-1]UJF31686.1 spore germination protein [Paenibacillus sp. YPD9-1]
MLPWSKFRSKSTLDHRHFADSSQLANGASPLLPCLEDNLQQIRVQFGQSPDITIRQFEVGATFTPVAVIYTDGIIDKDLVNTFILHSLMIDSEREDFERLSKEKGIFEFIRTNALTVGEVKVVDNWNGVILSILSGDTVILLDDNTHAMVCGTRGGEMRGVTEPTSQVVIRGPKDGFNESIGTNVALVRRRIRSSNLWLEPMKIGTVTQTDVAFMYIKGIANDKIVEEVRYRLQQINFDSILESGYIEQLIQDKTYTFFQP